MLSWLRSTCKHTVVSLTVTHMHTHTCTYHPCLTWFKVLKNFTKLGNDCLKKINHRRSATGSWWFVCAGDLAAQLWDPLECVGRNKSYNTNFSLLMETLQYQRKEDTAWVKAEQWQVLHGKKRRWPRQPCRLSLQESLQQTPLQFENWSCVVAFENWYLLLSFTKHMIYILSANNHDG